MADRLEQLRKLHQTDPQDPFVTYGIAMEHCKRNEHEEAIRWLDQTLTLDKHYCYAYFQKGRILSETSQTEDAVTALRAGMQAAQEAGDDHAHAEISQLLEEVG